MNITLIGMAGVGKTTVGKELAKRLNYKFIDIDNLIEEKNKMKLQQIVSSFGDEKFIEIEEKAVLELGRLENTIISTGGSIIYSKNAMNYLKNNSKIVFLNGSFETIEKNLKNQRTRGLVRLKTSLKELFYERLPLYRKYADISINVPDPFDIEGIIKEITNKIY